MALKLNTDRKKTIAVICRLDSAITNKKGYDDYLESFKEEDGPHEEHLKLKEGDQPTRFIMRRTLPFERKQQIRGNNFRVREKDVEMSINFMTDMVRAALLDVKNPDSVPQDLRLHVKRGKDGLVDGEFMNTLEEAGVLGDLIAAYQNATARDSQDEEETKNS